MGLFTNKTKIKEPAEFSSARKQLLQIGSSAPTFGVRGTAGMTDTELSGQDLLAGYVGGQSPEVANALASLGEASQTTNLMDIPEYKALFDTTRSNVNADINRVGRSLQISGNANSGAGAGVMLKSIGEANAQVMGAMAPYAQAERTRSLNAATSAAELATADTQSRLSAAKNFGALPRELEQLSLDAEYMANYLNATAPYQFQVPALQAVGGIGNTTVSGGGLSDLGMLVQAGASIAGGALAGRGGGTTNNYYG